MGGRVITNDFSWSRSRHEKLKECRRAYYYHYYRSWGGWELSAAPDIRELYVLKKLSNRFTWSGAVVHDVVKRALIRLRHGRDVSAAREIDRAHRLMRHDWRFSWSRDFWFQKYRREFSGLAEHEYAVPIPSEDWRHNWDSAQQALEWFFASRWVALARSLRREQWLEVDQDDFERATFAFEGVKVYAMPDFAYRELDGTPVVVDWKTGKVREGYGEQVLGYALYMSAAHHVPVERVRAVLVYLNEGIEQSVRVDPASVDGFRTHFRASVATMRDLLAFPPANVPKDEAAFARTDDLSRCEHCVFRRPCGRGPASATVRPPPRPEAQARFDFGNARM